MISKAISQTSDHFTCMPHRDMEGGGGGGGGGEYRYTKTSVSASHFTLKTAKTIVITR